MLLQTIKTHFPIDEIANCYGYGSNIINQANTHKSKMTDLLFIVRDIQDFHTANRKMNRSHYSSVEKILNFSTQVNNIGSKVYYHQNIFLDNKLFKYGVISLFDFIASLKTWNNMFIAGRFHKPIESIIQTVDCDELITQNRMQAFALIALTSKPKPFKDAFYQSIANISYQGDIRAIMRLEKKSKIKNMVQGAFEQYDSIYSHFAVENSKYKLTLKDDMEYYFNLLPTEFQKNFPQEFLKLNVIERKKVIERILKLKNVTYSSMAALSALYSSPSFNYVLDKYQRAYSH